MQTSEFESLCNRGERIIDAITSGISASLEAAADRLNLAAEVASVRTRMAAFSAVLDAVGAQKEVIQQRLAGATGAMAGLLRHQLKLLTAQEIAILQKAGLPQEAAQQALEVADRVGGEKVSTLSPGRGRKALGASVGTTSLNGHGEA